MFNHNLPLVLITWMIVIVMMAVIRRRKGVTGVGLILAYILNLSLIFGLPGILYLLPWYRGEWEDFTSVGTEMSLYGVLGFAFGSLAIASWVLDSGLLPRVSQVHCADARLPKAYLVVGMISYSILLVFTRGIASLTAIFSSGQELVVVGLSLCCWQAWQAGEKKKAIFWLAISLMLPAVTIVSIGFIGYGAVATLSILIFLSNFVRSKIKVVAAGMLVFYCAFSVYVTYMRDRNEIRRSVWGGESLSERLDHVSASASEFEWFDPFDNEHLYRVDKRMNQSYLVGAAVRHLEANGDYARGSTLVDAVLSMIPRIFWPDKQIFAGSGTLVARFTGFKFDNTTTSVGIGQVMEFYANFGETGVVVGFMVFGTILTILDVMATERLQAGDLHGFVLFYLPGLAFLQVGGQLTEITASAAASLVVALLVNRFLDRLQRKQGDLDDLSVTAVSAEQNI